MKPSQLLFALCALGLTSCGDDGSDPVGAAGSQAVAGAAGMGTGGTAGATNTAGTGGMPTVLPVGCDPGVVVAASCAVAGCHLGLSFMPALVGNTATDGQTLRSYIPFGCATFAGMPLVNTDPNASYLVQKLTNMTPCPANTASTMMPPPVGSGLEVLAQGGVIQPLTATEVTCLTTWAGILAQ